MKYFIYRFLDGKRKILYIGKTKDLDARIRAHFRNGHLDDDCYRKIKSIEYIVLDSKVAMDIYEIHFINKFQPPFNTSGKTEGDDFSLQDNAFKWKVMDLRGYNYKKKKKAELKNDFSEILATQELFMRYAKIIVGGSPNPLEEQKRIVKLLKDAAERVYTEAINRD